MAKNEIITEGKTLEQVKNELKAAIDKHNLAADAITRLKSEREVKKLKGEYDTLSLHTTYAKCLEDQNPMLDFIKTYFYKTASVTTDKDTGDFKLKDDGKAVMNLWDFVKFCNSINRQVAVALDWESKAEKARTNLTTQVQNHIENESELKIGEFKDAMQDAFNSIVMVPGENGNNSVIAKSKSMRTFLFACANMNTKTFEVKVAGNSWRSQFFALLHCAAKNKEFTVTYGDPDSDAEQETAEASEATTQEAPAVETAEAPETAEVKAE